MNNHGFYGKKHGINYDRSLKILYIRILYIQLIEMKKIYLVAFLLIAKFGYGQTIAPVHPSYAYSGPDNVNHSIDIEIQNTGLTPLTILVNRISQSMSVNHETYFCWFECYDPSTSLSPVPITLQPGESTINFHGYVTPHSVAGQDTVTYAFYDQNGNSDTLLITLTYDFIHDGINELSALKNSLSIFVGDNKTASINYTCNSISHSKIQISNILGTIVKEVNLSEKASSLKVSLDGIGQGIYFCNLMADDKIAASKKFIIQQ